MGLSPLGFVLQANVDFDKALVEKTLRDAPPVTMTVLNNDGYAAYLSRNISPQTIYYLRNADANGDENDWKEYAPVAYFDKYEYQVSALRDRLGLQVCNEPGFDAEISTRLLAFAKEAVKRRVMISLPGWAVGTSPDNVDGWAVKAHHDLLEFACLNPAYIALDFHEYFLLLWTSGMVKPDAKDALYFTTDLKRRNQWPKDYQELARTYHVWRVQYALQYCRSKFGVLPVVDIGEHGSDLVTEKPNSPLDTWVKSQPVPGGEFNWIRGWRTNKSFYEREFPGEDWRGVYTDSLAATWERGYKLMGVRSARLFTMGNSGKKNSATDWNSWDYLKDAPMLERLVKVYQGWAAPLPAPPPVYVPVPANKGDGVLITVAAMTSRNLRAEPSADAAAIGSIPNGEQVLLFQLTVDNDGARNWFWVERLTTPVGEQSAGWMAYEYTAPPVEPPELPPETVGNFRIEITLHGVTPAFAKAVALALTIRVIEDDAAA